MGLLIMLIRSWQFSSNTIGLGQYPLTNRLMFSLKLRHHIIHMMKTVLAIKTSMIYLGGFFF